MAARRLSDAMSRRAIAEGYGQGTTTAAANVTWDHNFFSRRRTLARSGLLSEVRNDAILEWRTRLVRTDRNPRGEP
jgi:hypothetical protein